jgi:D-alanyl-D-alanine carboxypeptidase
MLRFLLIFALSLFLSTSVWAEGRYASIIVDADTLDVIHARQIDAPRFPASLTKVMTLHLAFDALDAGELSLGERVKVSRTAARTPPVKLGLRAGQTITVDELIQSIAVRSHNDSAVVLAERLGGTEARFAEMMTAKARSLGMRRTTFKTANGLPHPEQKTTARDMAKLAHSILITHYDRYHYFGQKHFRGKKNTNALLHDMPEVDGFKTGYTNASGFNLMVSAVRGNRRQIAIVLGGASGKSRNAHMRDLVERGFDVMGVIPQAAPPAFILTSQSAPTAILRGASMRRAAKPWAIHLRNLPSEAEAVKLAAAISPATPPKISSGFIQG